MKIEADEECLIEQKDVWVVDNMCAALFSTQKLIPLSASVRYCHEMLLEMMLIQAKSEIYL